MVKGRGKKEGKVKTGGENGRKGKKKQLEKRRESGAR
jgi:hypothetical protein